LHKTSAGNRTGQQPGGRTIHVNVHQQHMLVLNYLYQIKSISHHKGLLPYYQPGFYPDHFVKQNDANRKKCEEKINGNDVKVFGLDITTSGCLNFTKAETTELYN
jgi:hypothetical protein